MFAGGGEMMPKKNKPGLIDFGNKLRAVREAQGLSQKQLADILDTDDRQISRYETGQVEMGAMLYDRFQKAFLGSEDPRTEMLLQQWALLSHENKEQLINLAIMYNKAQTVK